MSKVFATVLGLSLLIIPAEYRATLLLIIAAFLVPLTIFVKRYRMPWAWPFLLVSGAWIFSLLLWRFDSAIHVYGFFNACVNGAGSCVENLTTLKSSFGSVIDSFVEWLCLFSAAGILSLCLKNETFLLRFRKSLLIGSIPAAAYITCQICGWAPHGTTSQDGFWSSMGRISGTFTDPNAFGIASFLVSALILTEVALYTKAVRNLGIALSIVWIILGLYSGSRTLLIGCTVAVVVFCFLKDRRKTYIGLGITLSLLCVLQVFPLDLAGQALPSGIVRVYDSLQFSKLRAALFSREVFWIAAISIWMKNPLIGVGFDRFEEVFPQVGASLGFQLNGWVDNPNSLYLGILAELGIIGFAALLLMAAAFKKRPGSTREAVANAACIGFFVQLAFGPHLDFPEVALLAPVLIASAYTLKEPFLGPGRQLWIAACIAFLLLTIVMKDSFGTRGIWGSLTSWPPEDPWVSRTARFNLHCSEAGTARMKFHAPFAQFAQSPLLISLVSDTGEAHSLTVKNSDKLEVDFKCEHDPLSPEKWLPVGIRSHCSRYWIPGELRIGEDRRPLCYQLLR